MQRPFFNTAGSTEPSAFRGCQSSAAHSAEPSKRLHSGFTLTVAQLAAALRITTNAGVTPPEPILGILTRQLAVAESRIDLYAPEAPDDTKDEAAIRMIGYLYDAPPVSRNPGMAFVLSGARELLSSWHDLAAALV